MELPKTDAMTSDLKNHGLEGLQDRAHVSRCSLSGV